MSSKDNNPNLTEMLNLTRRFNDLKDKIDPVKILALTFLVIIGGYIRLIHEINLDFPLNDGGFFYQLVTELQQQNYHLPVFSAYNSSQIPFAYPPLGLYLSAITSDWFNLSVFDVLRILPALISILTIPAFYSLSNRIFNDKFSIIASTFAFTFIPTSFDWLIVGGGLTRSLGYLFAILTLSQVYDLFTKNSKRFIFTTIIFASLTLLSHPGTIRFAFYGALVIMLCKMEKNRFWVGICLSIGLGILLLTSPWWFTIIQRHGISVFAFPLQSESLSIASILTPFTFLFTNEPMLPLIALCGLLGFFIALKNHFFLLPVWLFATFLFEMRLGATYSVLPSSLLAGIGFKDGVLRIFQIDKGEQQNLAKSWLPRILIGYFAIYTIMGAYLSIDYHSVSQDERVAMQWIKSTTSENSRFLVLSGIKGYGIDYISEWFPVLSMRTSITTPQGHEWLPDNEFSKRIELHDNLQETALHCDNEIIACMNTWSYSHQIEYNFIYIPDSAQIQVGLTAMDSDSILYDGPGGIVIKP